MMDPLKLLSRSTRLRKPQIAESTHNTRPEVSGGNRQYQISEPDNISRPSRVRHGETNYESLDPPDILVRPSEIEAVDADDGYHEGQHGLGRAAIHGFTASEAKHILRRHKVKTTWLNPILSQERDRKHAKSETKSQIYPQPLQSFQQLESRFGVSDWLASNINEQGYSRPTEVQLAALPLLLAPPTEFLPQLDRIEGRSRPDQVDLMSVAPTGSGKTLAYLVPVLHRVHGEKVKRKTLSHQVRALILAPTKELTSQIVNEGRKLALNSGIRIAQLRKDMKISSQLNLATLPAERDNSSDMLPVAAKPDILVATPGLLCNLMTEENSEAINIFENVQYLVLDEADILLDPLFREQSLTVWKNLRNPNLRVSLWSATMSSSIEALCRSTIEDRRKTFETNENISFNATPLIRIVIGMKDSAIPHIHHRLIYAATEPGKLMALRQLLHPNTSHADGGPALRLPFLVFTQTIERAVALHAELLYDIPVEGGGSSRIAVLHSDLSDAARDRIMTQFRTGVVWVLITTDLLSRGIDFRGVNGVVNYDMPTSSAAYVHRVGRTGRAGQSGGVAVTLYSKEDVPYLKHVANVVAMARKQKDSSMDVDEDDLARWLLEALPKLSKAAKQRLKKGGIASRTTGGKASDSKAARRAKISTKAGFIRRTDNNRKAAMAASQRNFNRIFGADDESDFAGFD